MDCHGQGYDNGANMKGKRKGVQARVLKENPRAFYVPCACHSYNLVISDAAKSSVVSVTLFGTIQRLFVLFSASVKRWEILCKHVKGLSLKGHCETRWESRIESLKAIKYQYSEVINALQELASNTYADAAIHHEAQTLADQIMKFDFIVALNTWYDILFSVNYVSKSLQSKSMEMDNAIVLMDGCLKYVRDYRENGFCNAMINAKEITSELDIPADFAAVRHRRHRRMFDYESNEVIQETSEQRFKREFFLPLIDTVLV